MVGRVVAMVAALIVGLPPIWAHERTTEKTEQETGRLTPPDHERARTIAATLRDDPRLADDALIVEVAGKRVKLTGTVDTADEKRHAEDVVRSTDPTLTIENLLRAEETDVAAGGGAGARNNGSGNGAPKGKANGSVLSDGSITSKVKAKLSADDAIDARGIKVETTKRVVTLTGQVRSEGERQRAIAAARQTDGVLVVVDAMTIAPGR
jgi:hyperosmotically inducible protein